MLDLAKIPTPETTILYEKNQAIKFCNNIAKYPFVIKLSTGHQGNNVYLVQEKWEANFFIGELFGSGLKSFGYKPASLTRKQLRRIRSSYRMLKGNNPSTPDYFQSLEHGYFYVQEFLSGNEFDTRVTVIGNRAFAFRRFNRKNDFRASGSGLIDWNPENIDQKFIWLAFQVAQKLDV